VGSSRSSESDDGSATDAHDVVESLLRASRVLVAVAARSLAGVTRDVTVPQFRMLVVLAGRGPTNPGTLAADLGVHSSTVTRMCDRLAGKDLITRTVPAASRREVEVALTRAGRRVVDEVTGRRRAELGRIVERVPEAQRVSMVRALQAFGDATGEPSDDGWTLGWVDA
jgi:DNA-binding MarR family transcriptional regulator